ncbi:tRNA (adenosine(37)-N6)-threonylcarbamoyltransferase complex ATPase subunit type 1 TsaE [Sneathiella marina]|uniref:tRNA threonylcarbamoyladenosine biosynthesis protein TsaE n=1 Tax=Sneathiella marina TaxID=2950108 RepID=A0ABY4W2B4_9PROT|nr:tRNA (adenosine(37)-N6)-threonylcarbamoyltransferase complex ATPase subunit type 1 TsaE [Sneathiella marina]USG61332.1 tRNA (adenosine(37)-N6)-threonylcarbamoyltransferase complex ATPase subunit type 1 TsaE [Sneathiella marina]
MPEQPVILEKHLQSQSETIAFAHHFSSILKTGDVVTLSGTLGAGKTAFIRAVLQSLIDPALEVPSPTFNLLLTYDIPAQNTTVYHYDFYRVETPDEVLELDVDEAFDNGICLIEWADRMGPYLPDDFLDIAINPDTARGAEYRTLVLSGNMSWQTRLSSVKAAFGA